MTLVGADIAALRSLAATYDSQAFEMVALRTAVDVAVATVGWYGADADEFRAQWQSHLRPQLTAAAESLTTAATSLRANADAQEAASTDDGSFAPPNTDKTRERLPQPTGPTLVSTEITSISGGASLWFIEAGADRTMYVDEMSDGTFRVTVMTGHQVGATVATPTPYGQWSNADGTHALGVGAGASGGVRLGTGEEYVFSSQDEVDAFEQYLRGDTVRDTVIGATRGQTDPVARSLNFLGTVGGLIWDATDGYTPPRPTAVLAEGGLYASGFAGAGNLLDTLDAATGAHATLPGGISGTLGVNEKGVAGARYEPESGLTTVYVRGDYSVNASVFSSATTPWAPSTSGTGVQAITFDQNGKVVGTPPSAYLSVPSGGGTTETVDHWGGYLQYPLPPPVDGGALGLTYDKQRTTYGD